MTKTRINPLTLFSLSSILLFNPNINLIDPLPDFIGYIMMIFAIGSVAKFVPYLEEFKKSVAILALISAIRIPSFIIMYNNLGSGRDIIPLFTLVFVTLEAILLYQAVENGHKALCYIAERTNAASITSPISIGKNGRSISLSALKSLTYVFLISKLALNLAPELLLLTTEDVDLRLKLRNAYPATLVICILAACIIGIVWLVRARAYVKALATNGEIGAAISSLVITGTPEEQRKEKTVNKVRQNVVFSKIAEREIE